MPTIPWSSLKKAHDVLVQGADRFLTPGDAIPNVLFLLRVRSENGDITHCELADQKTAAYVLSDQPLMVARVREMLDENSALGRRAASSFGFVPNVVLHMSQVQYVVDARPSAYPSGASRSGLYVCVHTATESFPTLHPIVDEPTRHFEVREFPRNSCELTVSVAEVAP